MPLHTRNVAAVSSAIAGGNAEISLGSAKRFLSDHRWLGKTNRYSEKTIETLSNDRQAARAVNQRNLSQYISVSSLLHNSDGWAYLGRSVQSLLCGDANSALHLAYYAELRAAMSLLACYGIGVFKNRHYAITAPHAVTELPVQSATHVFAWDCLKFWASQPISGQDFAQIVRPYSKSLDSWLAPVSGGATITAQARDWFSQWGMDLKYFEDDRAARNDASYRPSGISNFPAVATGNVVNFVQDLWSGLEPTSLASFNGIDQHILRLSLETLFKARSGGEPSEKPDDFAQLLKTILDPQGLESPVYDYWERFLTRRELPADPSFFEYSRAEPTSKDDSQFSVISRAALLLRIASGTTDRLFATAGVTTEAIDFWRENVGVSRGLWEEQDRPTNLTDLFADVADALADFGQFASSGKQTYHNLGLSYGNVFAPLGGFERIAVWSVAAT